jgi:DNA-binding NarL/FixJ family response regulator
MATVLLADSQPLFNEALEALLSRGAAHQVIGRCSSAEDAFAYVSSLRPDLVLVDATLGLGGCANLVTRMLEVCPEARVIVLGDDHDADLLLAAIRSGAAGVVGNTYGAGMVLRVAGAVLEGEGAVPRGMLLELTRRTVSGTGRLPHRWRACPPRAPGARPAQPRLGQRPDRAGAVHQPAHRAYSHPEDPGELEMHSRLEAATFAMQQSMQLELTSGGLA